MFRTNSVGTDSKNVGFKHQIDTRHQGDSIRPENKINWPLKRTVHIFFHNVVQQLTTYAIFGCGIRILLPMVFCKSLWLSRNCDVNHEGISGDATSGDGKEWWKEWNVKNANVVERRVDPLVECGRGGARRFPLFGSACFAFFSLINQSTLSSNSKRKSYRVLFRIHF